MGELGSRAQTFSLCDALLVDAMSICKHRFGKYVMGCFVEHGSQQHVRRLTETLTKEVMTACLDQHACSVMSRILAPGATGPAERHMLSSAIVGTISSIGGQAQMFRSQVGAALLARAKEIAPACNDAVPSPARISLATVVGVSAGAEKRLRRGSGGGQFAQATAEARDLLESLRNACDKRLSGRIS